MSVPTLRAIVGHLTVTGPDRRSDSGPDRAGSGHYTSTAGSQMPGTNLLACPVAG
jgi:hypothetical protein